MKKISLAVVTALMLGFGMSGCGLFTNKTNQISVSYVKDAACKSFRDIMIFNDTKAEYYVQNEEKRHTQAKQRQRLLGEEGFNILDYNSGKMESIKYEYTERKDGVPEIFYCDKIEILNKISTDSKTFAFNGNGSNDFNVKIIKEVYKAQKVKEGKVTAKDIKITTYRLEKPIKVVKYNGVIYPEGSPTYNKVKSLRDKLTCLTINGATYCDGDLVKYEDKITVMIKVKDKNNADIFYYSNGEPSYVTANQYSSSIATKTPNAIGNHNLKEYDMSNIYTLQFHQIKTFKEW